MYFLQHVNRVFLRSEPIKNFSSFSVIPKAPYIERSYRDSIVIYFVYKKKGDKGVIFADMEINYDKLAAAILRQQQQQQPSVVPDAAILNPSEQERGASSSNTGNF